MKAQLCTSRCSIFMTAKTSCHDGDSTIIMLAVGTAVQRKKQTRPLN